MVGWYCIITPATICCCSRRLRRLRHPKVVVVDAVDRVHKTKKLVPASKCDRMMNVHMLETRSVVGRRRSSYWGMSGRYGWASCGDREKLLSARRENARKRRGKKRRKWLYTFCKGLSS